MTYPAFISKYIFVPAGMDHSFVLADNAPPSLRNDIVSLYYYPDLLSIQTENVDSIPFARMYYSILGNTYGSDGVYSTTADLFKFHLALQCGKILKKATLKKMYTPARLPGGRGYEAGNANSDYSSGYGLGWVLTRQRGGKIPANGYCEHKNGGRKSGNQGSRQWKWHPSTGHR